MIYQFAGYHRITLFFDTPNQCAAALGMIACLLSGCFCESVPRRIFKSKWSAAVAFAAITFLFVLVALTFSRGTYLAVVISLLFLAAFRQAYRLWALWLVATFLLILAIVPGGVSRVESVITPMEDASIYNRLRLWQDICIMAWDNFPFGVGFGNFREQFISWYQNHERFQVYTTGVSDYATLLANGGVTLLSTVLLILLLVISVGLRCATIPCMAGLIAASLCYLVAAAFSTLMFSPLVSGTFGCLILVTAFLAGRHFLRERIPFYPFVKAAVLTSVGLGLAATVFGFSRAQTVSTVPQGVATFGLKSNPRLAAVRPRGGPAEAIIFIIADRWFPELDARGLYRPLSAAGSFVVVLKPADFGQNGLDECTAIYEKLAANAAFASQPLYVIGVGEGGRLALLLGLSNPVPNLRGVVAVSPSYWHPFSGLSPINLIKGGKAPPLLLLRNEEERVHAAQSDREFSEKITAAGFSSKLGSFHGNRNEPGGYREMVGDYLLPFIDENRNFKK